MRHRWLAAVAIAAAAPLGAQNHPADVKFMQGMISHHAQAIEMSALIAKRSTSPAMLALGERITVSQRDEIKMMQQWLGDHKERVPSAATGMSSMEGMSGMEGMHDMSDHVMMPGMLTAAEMKALGAANGKAFDALFLQGMIKHHQGAITMVKELFGTNGAANRTDIFRFASDVDADQRAEIARMQAMLDAITKQK